MPDAPAEPYLSLIVPAYNEAGSIARTLGLMRDYLAKQPWEWEIIVSADGTDGTRERAAEFAAADPVLRQRLSVIGSDQRGGKGKGVRDGVLRARGRVIGFVDADYKTPIEEVEKVLPFLNEGGSAGGDARGNAGGDAGGDAGGAGGFDVAIGSRKVGESRIERPQRWYRRWGSRAFGVIMRSLVGLHGIRDTQCGFKFFTRKAARDVFGRQRVDGYMFDVEVLRLAKTLGYRIKEVGVRWQDDGDSRSPLVSGTFKHARDLLRIRFMKYPDAPPAPPPPPAPPAASASPPAASASPPAARAMQPVESHR